MYQIPEEIRGAIMACIFFTDSHGYKHASSLQTDANKALEWMQDNTVAGTPEPRFPLSQRFTEGERILIPGYSGSYPDASKNRWGYVTEIMRVVATVPHDRLIVTLDDEKLPRAINPDIVAHGNDWRYAKSDPENAGM